LSGEEKALAAIDRLRHDTWRVPKFRDRPERGASFVQRAGPALFVSMWSAFLQLAGPRSSFL
jgi:hypothetical protein